MEYLYKYLFYYIFVQETNGALYCIRRTTCRGSEERAASPSFLATKHPQRALSGCLFRRWRYGSSRKKRDGAKGVLQIIRTRPSGPLESDYPKSCPLHMVVSELTKEFFKLMPFKRHILPAGPMNMVSSLPWQDLPLSVILFAWPTICNKQFNITLF